MRYCEKCGVHVLGTLRNCPLCQGTLSGAADPAEDVYPDIPLSGRLHAPLLRLLILLSVAAAAACGAVLLCAPRHGWAALAVLAGLGSGWLTVGIALQKRKKPFKAVFWQVCCLSLLAVAWDWGTGFRGWSLDFVLPILWACTMLAVAVIARLLRFQPQDYLVYLVMNILLGLLPLLLLLCGVLRVVYPAAVCVAVSLVLLAILALFEGPALREELLRRLHL